MQKRILVIGSSNADMIMKLPKLPARGETVTDGEFMQTFGGKGANQAVAAARAGGNVSFVSCVGQDSLGDQMVENFRRDGIDVSHMLRSTLPSGAALIMFDQRGDNYLAVAPGSNYEIHPEHIDGLKELIAGSSMVVLQMEIPADTIRRVLEVASAASVPTMLNYAPARCELPLPQAITGLIVNEAEASALLGRQVEDVPTAQAGALALRQLGPKFAVITLGVHGVCVSSAEGDFHLPAYDVKATDSTAAGDTFCGAMAVAVCNGEPLSEAVKYASAAAAVCVTRMGAQPSIPRTEEIRAMMATGKTLK
jgi:ribokinase